MAEEKGAAAQELKDPIYDFEGNITLKKAVPFGMQHVLAMFVSNIAPILIVTGVVKMPPEQVGALVQAAMIMAGYWFPASDVPDWPFGQPAAGDMGISFTFVSTFLRHRGQIWLRGYFGSCPCGRYFWKGPLGMICPAGGGAFIPPIVSASVVTAIGFSLLGIGANSFGGGFGNPNFGDAKYLIVGTITLLSCLIFNIKAKSFMKQLSVLFGLVVGYIAAYFYGMVDLSRIATAGLFSLPHPMPYALEFHPDAIFSVFLIFPGFRHGNPGGYFRPDGYGLWPECYG